MYNKAHFAIVYLFTRKADSMYFIYFFEFYLQIEWFVIQINKGSIDIVVVLLILHLRWNLQ